MTKPVFSYRLYLLSERSFFILQPLADSHWQGNPPSRKETEEDIMHQASSILPVKHGAAIHHEELVPQEQQTEQYMITTTAKSQIGSVEYYKGRRIFTSVKTHYSPSPSHTD